MHALANPTTNEVKEYQSNVDPTVATRPPWKWLPVQETDPAYDPAGQVKEGPVVTVFADKVTRTWAVRAKTAQELDGEKDAVVNGMDLVLLKVAFNHENRVRVLEGKQPITLAQFKAAIKALL